MYFEYLSHIINNNTPTYGNEYTIEIDMPYSIKNGSIANESRVSTTTHIGTHIDLPYHFYDDGDTVEKYDASFWIFDTPLMISIEPKSDIIYQEVIDNLNNHKTSAYIDLIIVKTGIEKYRGKKEFWSSNPGFAPKLYTYLKKTFPKLRAFGFDSISLSSFKHPKTGVKAHKAFLNPKAPLIVIEDMHLSHIKSTDSIKNITVAPLRIENCDGVPCTIIAKVESK